MPDPLGVEVRLVSLVWAVFCLVAFGAGQEKLDYSYRNFWRTAALPVVEEFQKVDQFRAALRRAQSLANAGQYSEALDVLQKHIWDEPPGLILSDDSDPFLPQERAMKLAETFPEKFLELNYGEQGLYSAASQKYLDEANEKGAISDLTRVLYRYPFTRAGAQAAHLLPYLYRDHGDLLGAYRIMEQIRSFAPWRKYQDEFGWAHAGIIYGELGLTDKVKLAAREIESFRPRNVPYYGEDLSPKEWESRLIARSQAVNPKMAMYLAREIPQFTFGGVDTAWQSVSFINGSEFLLHSHDHRTLFSFELQAVGSEQRSAVPVVLERPRFDLSLFPVSDDRILVAEQPGKLDFFHWQREHLKVEAQITLPHAPEDEFVFDIERLDAERFVLARYETVDESEESSAYYDLFEIAGGQYRYLGEILRGEAGNFHPLDDNHIVVVTQGKVSVRRMNRKLGRLETVEELTLKAKNFPSSTALPGGGLVVSGQYWDGRNSIFSLTHFTWDGSRLSESAFYKTTERLAGDVSPIDQDLFAVTTNEEIPTVIFFQIGPPGHIQPYYRWQAPVETESRDSFLLLPLKTQAGTIVFANESGVRFFQRGAGTLHPLATLAFPTKMVDFTVHPETGAAVAIFHTEDRETRYASFHVPNPFPMNHPNL